MSILKRQHWVPRFYLRYFAVPDQRRGKGDPRVWVFQREGGEPSLRRISNVAVENHLYSPRTGEGDRLLQVEKQLAETEAILAKLWPDLAKNFVDLGSDSVRKALGLFLALQFLRHPDQRQRLKDYRKHLQIALAEATPGEDAYIQLGQQTIHLTPEEVGEWMRADESNDAIEFVAGIPELAVNYAQVLMERRWSVVVIDEPRFITSDFPFFVINPELKRHQIADASAMLLFPLSPTRMLCIDDLNQPNNQYYPVPLDGADLYNFFVWVNTESLMISSRDVYDVLPGIIRIHDEAKAEHAKAGNGT